MSCVPVKGVFPTAGRHSKLPVTPTGDKRQLSEDGWKFFLSPSSLNALRQTFTQGQMATAAKPQITEFLHGFSHPKTAAIGTISDSLWWMKQTNNQQRCSRSTLVNTSKMRMFNCRLSPKMRRQGNAHFCRNRVDWRVQRGRKLKIKAIEKIIFL